MHDPGVNRGPIPTPAPRDLSRPQANDRPPEQQAPMAALRRLPEIPSQMGGLRMASHHPASRTDSGLSCSSRGGTSDNYSSDYDTGSRDTHTDTHRDAPRHNKQRLHLPTRTISMTSGFATTGRPKKPSHNPAGVKRSKSFQVGSRNPPKEEGVTKEMMKGHVARYVQQLEQGIQKTVENMKPRKVLLPGDNSPCRSPARDAPPSPVKDFYNSSRSRSLGRRPREKQLSSPSDGSDTGIYDDRNSSYLGHSGHSSGHSRGSSAPGRTSDSASDIALDTEKIVPEGDDYKLVFISSDSSKDSELNSSIDSDNSGSVSRKGVSSGDNGGGFIEESDWDYYESRSQKGSASGGASVRKVSAPMRVDAAMMTEPEFLSGSEGETDLDTSRDEDPQDASLHFSLRVPSPLSHTTHLRQDSDISNTTTESQEVQVSFDSPTTPQSPYGITSDGLLAPLSTLGTEDLRAMLRQTEAVQAEAQALQAALMGAFNPMDPLHGRRWFKRGDSTRSSAERSLDELSCHDQFRRGALTPHSPSRTPHDSPALREYRKRVLTEIQNYYGVEGGLEALHEGRRGRSVSPSISNSAASTISALSYQTDSTAQLMPSCPSRSSSAPSTGARKSSRDICIQTDPDIGGPWDSDDDMTDVTCSPMPSPPSRTRGTSVTKGVYTQARPYSSSRTRADVDSNVLRRPHGVSDGRNSSSSPGQVGAGGEGGGGMCGIPPYLCDGVPTTIPPDPPAFHLHLTLSREASVALTSDSEAEDRPPSSSRASSVYGVDTASDFEYGGSVCSDSVIKRFNSTPLEGSSALSDDVAKVQCSSRTKEQSLDSSHGARLPLPQHQPHRGAGGAWQHTTAVAHPTTYSIRPPRPAPRRHYTQGRPMAAMDAPVAAAALPGPPHVAKGPGDSDAQQRGIPKESSPVAPHKPKEYIIPITIETSDDEKNTKEGVGQDKKDNTDAPDARLATPSSDDNKDTAKGVLSSGDSSVTSSRDVSVTNSPRDAASNPNSPRDAPDIPKNMSSDTSESDDTDDDVHVSRTYDLSTSEDLLDERTQEGRGSASSASTSSAEDTDDEKHVSKEYSLTKSSSDSDSEVKEELPGVSDTTDAVMEADDNEDAESTASADTASTVSLAEAVNQDVSLLEEDFEEDLSEGGVHEEGSGGQGMEAINKNICDLNVNSYNIESDIYSDNIDSACSENNKESTSDLNASFKVLNISDKSQKSNFHKTNTKSQGDCRVVSEILKVHKESSNTSAATTLHSAEASSPSGVDNESGDQLEVGEGQVSAHAQQSEAGVDAGAVAAAATSTTQLETHAAATVSTPLDTIQAPRTPPHTAGEQGSDKSCDENTVQELVSDTETVVRDSSVISSTSSLEETDEGVVVESPVPEDAPDGDSSHTQGADSSGEGCAVPLRGGEEVVGGSISVSGVVGSATTAAGDTGPPPLPPPPLPQHQSGESEGRSTEHLSTHHAAGDQTAAAQRIQDALQQQQRQGLSGTTPVPQGSAAANTAAPASPKDDCTGAELAVTEGTTTVAAVVAVLPSSGNSQVEQQDAKEASTSPPGSPVTSPLGDTNTVLDQTIENCDDFVNEKESKVKGSESVSSSESGHSSAGESEVEDETDHLVKINISEDHERQDGVSIPIVGEGSNKQNKHTVTRFAVRRVSSPESGPRHTPPVPSRRSKRSSSSDGLSSSSDIERSDADASDSADTVIEGGKLHSELRRFALQQRSILHDHDDKGRDSDGPSSADSVLHGNDSESQCSDNSDEGNLVSIVSVGDEDDQSTKCSSHGRIYIRSDSTDSDVQIKPTCIVVTGSSGQESGDDLGENEKSEMLKRNDVTILAVTSDARMEHVMSVHVTSPDSSRSTSPARKAHLNDLQTMILTTRQQQQQFRRSPTEMRESSGLANYFTLTLGTDSPVAPRRYNKTPEVRRRKIDRPEIIESPAPTSPASPIPVSPSPAQTPDHSEGDLLAYEEHHGIDIEESYSLQQEYESGEETEHQDSMVSFSEDIESFEDVSFDETQHQFLDSDDFNVPEHFLEGHQSLENDDGRLDSIEDESINSESYYSESSGDEAYERENDLRGYCNRAIDFTLHTIIEESCEESDYDRRSKEEEHTNMDQSELEKYFFFGLGNGPAESRKYANEESEYSDTFSETASSIFSEGVESYDANFDPDMDPAELASSRLEKYFLTSFQGFERQPSIRSMGEDSELRTDESDSVGSDSEGSPSPEQPRKKLLRPRGFRVGMAGRCQTNLDGNPSDGSHHSENDEIDRSLVSGEDEGSTESEEIAFEKGDGQFDTIKRRKKKKSSSDYSDKRSDSDKSELKAVEMIEHAHDNEELDSKITDLTKSLQEGDRTGKRVTIDCDRDSKDRDDDRTDSKGDLSERKYQSRDSGFIGSSDDLLKDKPEDKDQKERLSSESSADGDGDKSKTKTQGENGDSSGSNKNGNNKSDSFDNDSNNNKSENEERSSNEGKVSRSSTGSSADLPPFSPSKIRNKISRKDSFNAWSSDEETNIMMSKMRAFFKTMIINNVTQTHPQQNPRKKPPQLLVFESKLTNLMKTVPGINDEQVKEIVEYLSSEDTWSDSYDSSDYTSSDLEGTHALLENADPELKSELQEQISASCQQIIQKFDLSREPSDTESIHSLFGGRCYSESSEDASPSSKDTVFMYQRLMSSISRYRPDSDRGSIGSGSQSTSPPLLAKVMHHIGNRLVALMHEVSGGSENGDDDSLSGGHPVTSSPKQPLFIRKHRSVDSLSLDSSVDKSSLTSTSFESEDSPTDTEQSPESDLGTPKIKKSQGPLSIISERSSAEDFTSLESQRTVFASHESPRHTTRLDSARPSQATASQRSLKREVLLTYSTL
ncbi:unnamed protein product [Meganyctiphanes norvegica]|uniref:Uncharacterized protein n=1 Tax=Meganyctiphanes norvegica TaxID=48144 RepID=A0AAV2PKX4_MEGNR